MLEDLVRDEDVFMIAALFATGITAIVVFGCGWVVVSITRILSDARLKHVMIDRGMTAEEIAKVIEAGSDEGAEKGVKSKVSDTQKAAVGWKS